MKNYLEERYKNNTTAFFQRVQTKQFVGLLGKKYENVLEEGCGRGYWSYVGVKHKKFKNIYGCDVKGNWEIGPTSLKLRGVKEFKIIENGKIPFKNSSFDLVFSMDVIEHVEDDINFIKENIRVCKKGGEIIIGTPNLNRVANIFLKIIGRLKFPMNLGKDYYGDCVHLREYTPDLLIKKISEAGNGEIGSENIFVYPCWMGILQYNLGIEKLPGFLKKFCQFWFVKIKNPDVARGVHTRCGH